MSKKTGIIALITGVIVVAVGIITKIKENQALSVIGGADGPTAIFVAGKVGTPWYEGITNGVIVIVIGVIIISRKK